jgi:hypothetical protein
MAPRLSGRAQSKKAKASTAPVDERKSMMPFYGGEATELPSGDHRQALRRVSSARLLASSAGKKISTRSSSSVTSRALPRVVTVENRLSARSPHFASFHDKLVSFENGPIDVQVFANVAVSQGTVKEQRSRDGQDTSGEFAWMDLLEKRAGRWVVVRSAAARLAPPGSPGAPSQDPAAAHAIRAFEQHIGDAMVAFDIDTLRGTHADDWATVLKSGSVFAQAIG